MLINDSWLNTILVFLLISSILIGWVIGLVKFRMYMKGQERLKKLRLYSERQKNKEIHKADLKQAKLVKKQVKLNNKKAKKNKFAKKADKHLGIKK